MWKSATGSQPLSLMWLAANLKFGRVFPYDHDSGLINITSSLFRVSPVDTDQPKFVYNNSHPVIPAVSRMFCRMVVFSALMKPETRINWIGFEFINRTPAFQSFTVLKLYMRNKGNFCRKEAKVLSTKT